MIEAKTTATQNIKLFFSQRRSYFLGIVLGVTLLIVNVYVGLYMVNLLVGEDYIPLLDGISLPVIKQEDYDIFKQDYLERQVWTPRTNIPADPFRSY